MSVSGLGVGEGDPLSCTRLPVLFDMSKLIQLADKYRILKLNSDLIAAELSDGLKSYSCFQIINFFFNLSEKIKLYFHRLSL